MGTTGCPNSLHQGFLCSIDKKFSKERKEGTDGRRRTFCLCPRREGGSRRTHNFRENRSVPREKITLKLHSFPNDGFFQKDLDAVSLSCFSPCQSVLPIKKSFLTIPPSALEKGEEGLLSEMNADENGKKRRRRGGKAFLF